MPPEDGRADAALRLMRLVSSAQRPGDVDAALARAPDAAVEGLWRADPALWPRVKGVLDAALAEETSSPTVDGWAEVFDRAVAISPEASVAAYSLGRPDLLDAATEEVVGRLRAWGLVRADAEVFELGCGIGRFGQALAPRVKSYAGVDVSGGMIREARRRCAGLANVAFEQSEGRDLRMRRDASATLVLAIDVFPYLVAPGLALAAVHMREIRRILRPGGEAVIFNFSYRQDGEQDRHDVRSLAQEAGLSPAPAEPDLLTVWDGAAYRLRRL